MNFSNQQRKASGDQISASGFTLVELLLVVSILAILSSLSLVVIAGAQTDARRAATQSLISQIDEILKQRMEDYEVRRTPFPLTEYTGVFVDDDGDGERNNDENTIDREFLREVKQRILADVINAEMPREFTDVAWREDNNTNFPGTVQDDGLRDWLDEQINDNGFLIYGGNIPSLVQEENLLTSLQGRPPVLATRFQVLGSANPNNYPDNSSEYLYRILQATDYDGTPAIDYLRGNAIGDTDGDGFLEILDSWGNPMAFGFQVFDDDGNYVAGDMEISAILGAAPNGGLAPGQNGDAPAVQNLQIRIVSTGDGGEVITN